MLALGVQRSATNAAIWMLVLALAAALGQIHMHASAQSYNELGICHVVVRFRWRLQPTTGTRSTCTPHATAVCGSSAASSETSEAAAARGADANVCCEAATASSPTNAASSLNAVRRTCVACGKHRWAQGLTEVRALVP